MGQNVSLFFLLIPETILGGEDKDESGKGSNVVETTNTLPCFLLDFVPSPVMGSGESEATEQGTQLEPSASTFPLLRMR